MDTLDEDITYVMSKSNEQMHAYLLLTNTRTGAYIVHSQMQT